MRKRIIIVALLAAVAIAALVTYSRTRASENGRILVSGNLELEQADIAFKTSGRLVERPVDEGDAVHKGQVVGRLDRAQLERQREAQVAALEAATALLAQARTALEWQRETLEADLAQRRATLGAAQSRLLELKNGARPQEVQEARAAVEAARTEAERARADWERAQPLYKADVISTAQYDQYRTRAEAAAAALKQAQQRLSLVEAGPRVETIEAAASQVDAARAALRLGEANQIELKRRQEEIAARQAEIERAKAQIAFIDAQLADTVAASPIDGVVLVKAAEVGEVVAPGTAILTVGDIERPWLRAYINEADLGRVKLGDRARLTTDSFPGKVYEGRVTFIASEAEFTPKQIQTQEERVKLVYRVKIDVANPHRELKNNMPVDAEILVGN